jgi:EAL domain-containing protein (putative c-di-GMP-specific phosphodiesterase class I)
MKRAPETLEASRKRFPQGTVIFREREPADCAYIIECGRVEISTAVGGEYRVLTHLGPGEMFGEMAVLDGTARSATATAAEDTELTLIVEEQLKSRVEAAEPVLRMLLRVILHRFRHEQSLFRHMTDVETAQRVQFGATVGPEKGAIDKIRLESALREALSRNELHLSYQPIVDLETGEITGFEALLRWSHPVLGCVPTQEFIQLAEESALIVPIGRWVLERACRDLLRLQDRHGSDLTMSVNVSGRQFAEPSFNTELSQVIRDTGIDPYRLKLEITEGVLMDYRSHLEQCKSLGTRIALDDFGTGFSNLRQLASFPLDTLKIDRSFVVAMLTDPKIMIIVLAISQLAHGLGFDLVAEGIEEEAQKTALLRMSCDYGQGYLFSKAVPFIEAMELLRDPVKVTP